MVLTPKFIFLACLSVLLCLSCKSDTKQNAADAGEPEVSSSLPYPALGNQDISQLYAQADKVDIIFFYLPISVNQEDPASVKSTVLYVAPAAPKVTNTCKAIARLSWIADGAIIKEADVYIDAGCEYLLFMENNQPVAANAMSPAGVDFFRKIISQVEQKTK
jgi:hypothetical protein